MVVIREDFARALARALTETVENMTFMEVLPASAEAWAGQVEAPLVVQLQLLAPAPGELLLSAPRALLRKAAATLFLLNETEIDEPLLVDIASELINTLAGRFLSHLLSPHQPFQLGLPKFQQIAPNHRQQLGAIWHFRAENMVLALEARGEALLCLQDQIPVAEG